MKGSPEREVVLEIEHVRVVRKRASTYLQHCRECARSTDFVSLTKAADLFGITPAELYDFTRSNRCHFEIGRGGDIYICLTNLLSEMSKRMKNGRVKLLGERL